MPLIINKTPSEPSLVPINNIKQTILIAKITYQSIIRLPLGSKTSRQRLLFWGILDSNFPTALFS